MLLLHHFSFIFRFLHFDVWLYISGAALLATKLCCIHLISLPSCVLARGCCGKSAVVLGKLMVCV